MEAQEGYVIAQGYTASVGKAMQASRDINGLYALVPLCRE